MRSKDRRREAGGEDRTEVGGFSSDAVMVEVKEGR